MTPRLLFGGLVVALLLPMSAWAGSKSASKAGLTVTMTGPAACSRDETVTITIRLEASHGGGGETGFVYDVSLREKDVFVDDHIGSKRIVGPGEPGPFQRRVTFTFRPRKFERSKTLELYFVVKRSVQGIPTFATITNKSDPLRVRCR